MQNNFTIYKSSAGSGKTFTLVKEYLALALNDKENPPKAYSHILAITFTNKAAFEMKERIVNALKELSSDDYDSLTIGTKNLLAELKAHKILNKDGQLKDDEIRIRAARVLSAVLHNYSDFAIGTIDSFVYKVIRTFAFDLKISMSFEMEMDVNKLVSQAVDLLIAEIGNDDNLTKALVEFTESKTDDEKSWHIENDLNYFAANLLDDEGSIHIDRLKELKVDDFFKIKNVLKTEIEKFESFIRKSGEKALKKIQVVGIDEMMLAGGKSGIYKYFSYLANVKYDSLKPTNTVAKYIGEDKWYSGKATKEDKISIDSIKGELLEIYNEVNSYIDKHLQEAMLFNIINKTIYSLAVLNEIEKLLIEYKEQNNILHISEFNKLISKIVSNEPVPFIYERLGEKYNNYLIDEFQDTSVLQFQNLLPLIDNSLASGYFTMLVGDGKQAIYRWRGGEVEQFSMLPQVFRHNNNPLVLEREEALVRNHNPQVLNKNFRSKREVIEFNNNFFRVLSGKLTDKYQNIYDKLEQGYNEENVGGYVEVEFVDGERNEVRERNLERTYSIIQDTLEQGYALKDIAILIRRNVDGSEIANFLSEKGIEVISSDSLLLNNSREVNFIGSLLRFIDNNTDQIAKAEVLEYLEYSGLFLRRTLNQLLFEDVGREKNNLEEQAEYFIAVLDEVCGKFDFDGLLKMSLYELNEELVRLFKLGDKPNAYIQFYLDEVYEYSVRKNNNLKDFIEYWEEQKNKASLVTPQGLNAVTIMTIHKAKGLEFPIVILPFSNGNIDRGKKHMWLDLKNSKLPQLPSVIVRTSKDMLETEFGEVYEDELSKGLLDTLNILYVALTRPEEKLYVLTGMPSKNLDNLNSLSDLFAFYYMSTGEWEEGKLTYAFGHSVSKASTEKSKQASFVRTVQMEGFNSNKWRESIKMRAAAPSIWNLDLLDNKKDYGVKVHTAMAKIKTEKDIGKSVNSMLGEGLLNTEECEDLIKLIEKIVSHPQLKPHFKEGLIVKNEMEIITERGEMFRPDRVTIEGKDVTIIDYKTGEERERDKKQLQTYADILKQMGYTVKEKLLVYLEEEKIVNC